MASLGIFVRERENTDWITSTVLISNIVFIFRYIYIPTVYVYMFMWNVGLQLTSGNNPFQPDDVGVVKLAHDACLTEEIPPLLLCVACFQTLDGHMDLPFTGQTQTSTAHLSKLTWIRTHGHMA